MPAWRPRPSPSSIPAGWRATASPGGPPTASRCQAEEGYHRALADAQVSAGLFLCCLDRLGGDRQRPLSDLARRAGGWLTMAGVAAAARQVPAGFEPLQEAIRGERQAVLRYDAGGRGRVRSSRVAPKVLYNSGRHTYLEAFCYDGRYVKSFRLDRVVGYEVLEQSTRL